MKYLERRTKFEACEGKNNMDVNGGAILMDRPNGCLLLPMDLAMKEVESKGSLVDRVAALESRLFQVKRAIIQVVWSFLQNFYRQIIFFFFFFYLF